MPRPLTLLMIAAAPIALAACGQKPADTTPDLNTVAATDNLVVPPDETVNSTAPVTTAEFVDKAANSDMYEIAASKLAAANADSATVKSFATQMIAAHTATTAALKAALAKGKAGVTPPAALDAEHEALLNALKAAKGADFDALYKSQQADAHAKALALLQGYAATGDNADLKAFAADTVPKVQSHIDMLGKL